jgi:hypothetical protein
MAWLILLSVGLNFLIVRFDLSIAGFDFLIARLLLMMTRFNLRISFLRDHTQENIVI